MLSLIRPSLSYETGFREMMEDYKRHYEDTFDSDYFTKDFDFACYIKDMEELSKGVGLPPGYVPTTEFWLVNDAGNIVGTARLRHYLSERNSLEGGHIGYDISPSFRRQGYGTKLLQLTLVKAKEFGIKRALLTCDADNTASIKVIENNGGKFENEIISKDSSKVVYRYWIEV